MSENWQGQDDNCKTEGNKMKFKQLAKEIAHREFKKEEVDIAQISEILKVLFDIISEYPLGFEDLSKKEMLKRIEKPKKKVKAKKL
jgi:hypothetical protein